MTISNEKKVKTELETGNCSINSVGMKMIEIKPGTFMMGNEDAGDWDERPVHKVTLTQPFYIGQIPVTIEQFQQFRSECSPTDEHEPYMAGISWYEAVEFCEWLSEREGKPYRLPTESEWEYVCKIGLDTSKDAGDEDKTNHQDVKNMLNGVREWCHDWHGEYLLDEQEDPVGPGQGMSRVVRGGVLDRGHGRCNRAHFARPTYRSGIAPGFGHYSDDDDTSFGFHTIGFRVVQAPMPETEPYDVNPPFAQQGIKQNNKHMERGPVLDQPYFRKRYLLPAPPETTHHATRETIDLAGLHPALRYHNHSPAVTICPNGDILYVVYTSYTEREPGVSLVSTRLRYGAEQWDMPELQFDFPGSSCHGPLLWNDDGTLHCFWGNPGLENSFPFQWVSSEDNGATWSEVKFPRMGDYIIPGKRQPISSAFRDKEGSIRIACDGAGTILWSSDDNGKTWYDPASKDLESNYVDGGTGNHIAGIHAGVVELDDGRFMALGRGASIDGCIPMSISDDMGKTWTYHKTAFPGIGGNQRISLTRLKSGRLFMAGDYQDIKGVQPDGVDEKGSYVALSEDEGQTWHVKKLYGAEAHRTISKMLGHPTIGYSVTRQTPDGIIQLITSLNRHALHFAMNEAWILDEEANETDDAVLMQSSATEIKNVEKYSECYSNGKVRVSWSGGIANDGRFLLHGPEIWYYENGQKMREATYKLGYQIGKETCWAKDGKKRWQWEYDKDGKDVWTQWWSNGQKKNLSEWKVFKADGPAISWDENGEIVNQGEFRDGDLLLQQDSVKYRLKVFPSKQV